MWSVGHVDLTSCLPLRVTPRGRSWSAPRFPPSSTGRESLRCGRPTCTWWRTSETKTAEPSSGRTSSPSRTTPSEEGRRRPGWRWEEAGRRWRSPGWVQLRMERVETCFNSILCWFHPTERFVDQVPRPADLLRADHHRHGDPGLHRLGLPGGGRGPQTEEQPVQGTDAQDHLINNQVS